MLTIRNMPPLAFGIHNEQYDLCYGYNMRVIIVGTEATQGFTVGNATQVPSGRVWETQPVRHHVGHPGDMVYRIVLLLRIVSINILKLVNYRGR